jgi:hyaluronan synthase
MTSPTLLSGGSPRRVRTVGWVTAAVALVALAIYRGWAFANYPATFTAIFFTVGAGIAVVFFVAAARGAEGSAGQRRVADDGVPPGRVIAVVPSYNEDPDALHDTVRALLNSTADIECVHVVDDGSTTPVPTFPHERVQWWRQDNAGKREAQAAVLRTYVGSDVAFIVTVDSDSVVDPNAVEVALRAMNDPEVQAVTSTILVRRLRGLWSRLTDLEIVNGVNLVRRARAAFGAVAPTSGALSVYRAAPVLDNLDDYVTSGTFSDDRRLAHYCLLRGKVIALEDVVVSTDMPTTLKGVWRQRVRWYKGYWKYLPWEAAHLDGAAMWLRFYNTLLAAVYPLGLFWIAVWMPLTGKGFFWPPFALWLVLLYAQGFAYATRRPHMGAAQRWGTYLLLTPLMIPFQILVIRPALYWALFAVRSERWDGHRETRAADPAAPPLAPERS